MVADADDTDIRSVLTEAVPDVTGAAGVLADAVVLLPLALPLALGDCPIGAAVLLVAPIMLLATSCRLGADGRTGF